jgi:glycosyltransferase involved in cell wall biosynthesis
VDSKTKVVILSFNHEGITSKCVQSALNFFKSNDIILVHNGSRENSVKILKEEFPNITHLEFRDNKGFSGGANRGINFAFQKTDCQQMLFLSNDTQLTKFTQPTIISEKFLGAPIVELRETGTTHSFGAQVSLKSGRLEHLTLTSETPQQGFYVPGSTF